VKSLGHDERAMPRTSKPAKRKPAAKPKKPARTKPKRPSLAAQVAAFESASKLLNQIEQEEAEDAEELARLERPSLKRRSRRSRADMDLVSAAYYGSIEHAKKALAAGASPDARDEISEHTALYMAVAQNQVAMVEFLLANGADPNATVIANIRGLSIVEITPLTRAKDEGKRAIAKVLERHGGRYLRNDT
jgi:hypothetical protein